MANPLVNVLTPKLRGYLYAAYFVAGLVLGACQIAGVDTGKTADVLVYIGAALGLTAASNASPTPVEGRHVAGEGGTIDLGLGILIAILVIVILLFFRVHA